MALTIEQQVELLGSMLEAVAMDPIWDPQREIGKGMPCSFADLDTWVREAPNEDRERLTSEIVARMTRMREIADVEPSQFEGMVNLADDDPRLPALIDVLAAKWPSQAQVDLIVQQYVCALRTQQELLKLQPHIENTALGGALAKGIAETGKSADDLGREFEAAIAFIMRMKDVRPSLPTRDLQIVSVEAPNINLLFSPTGKQAAYDETASLDLPEATGPGFLQSRYSDPGEPGTTAAGMRSYMYRVSLDGVAAPAGIVSIRLPIGSYTTLSFRNAAVDTHGELFVITKGAIGGRALARAQVTGGQTVATFDMPVRGGDSSFFFGFAAGGAPVPGVAVLADENGNDYSLRCIVPGPEAAPNDDPQP